MGWYFLEQKVEIGSYYLLFSLQDSDRVASAMFPPPLEVEL